jgi:hypothetical protein
MLALLAYFMLYLCSKSVKEGFHGSNRGGINGTSHSDIPDFSNNSVADSLWVGNLESDCYNLSVDKCMKASNCGLCQRNGCSKCIPGDFEGAMFEEDCEHWKYTDYLERKTTNEKVCKKVLPWSHRYPEYKYSNLHRPF